MNTGWSEYWIGFSTAAGNSNLETVLNGKTIFKIGLQEHIIAKFDEALDVATSEGNHYQLILSSLAENILSYILYYDESLKRNNSMNIKIDAARSIIRENIMTDITPEQIAEMVGMSYSWLRKVFKKNLGLSINQYITSLKMQKAKNMLLNSHESIKEIAFSLQYFDTAYFSSIFKKNIGMTPSEYRILHKPKSD